MMMMVYIGTLWRIVSFIFRCWLDFELYNLTLYVFWNALCSVLCQWLDFDQHREMVEILYDPYKTDRNNDDGRMRNIFEWKVYRKTVFDWVKIAIKVWFLHIQTSLILSLLSNRYVFITLSTELAMSFVVVPVVLYLIHCIFATVVTQLRSNGWPCNGEVVIEFRSWPPLFVQLRAPHWL